MAELQLTRQQSSIMSTSRGGHRHSLFEEDMSPGRASSVKRSTEREEGRALRLADALDGVNSTDDENDILSFDISSCENLPSLTMVRQPGVMYQRRPATITVQNVETDEQLSANSAKSDKVAEDKEFTQLDQILKLTEDLPVAGNITDMSISQKFQRSEAIRGIFNQLQSFVAPPSQAKKDLQPVHILSSGSSQGEDVLPATTTGQIHNDSTDDNTQRLQFNDQEGTQIVQRQLSVEKLNQILKRQAVYDQISLEKYPMTWQEEIKEASEDDMDQSEEIRGKYGVLGLLVWLRLTGYARRHQYVIKKSNIKIRDSEAEQQMAFNSHKPVPNTEKEFLAYVVQRLMNLYNYQQGKQSQSGVNVPDLALLQVKDQIMPSTTELNECIKNNVMTKSDALFFKLIIQYKLLTCSTKLSKKKTAVKSALKYYKKITNSRLEETSEVITEIYKETKRNFVIQGKLNEIKDKLYEKIRDDEYVCKFMIQIYNLQDFLHDAKESHGSLSTILQRFGEQQNKNGEKTFLDHVYTQCLQNKGALITEYEEQLLQCQNQETFKKCKKSMKKGLKRLADQPDKFYL